MYTEQIVALIVFSLLHLLLAGMLLQDLVNRKRVLGGRKAPWAIVILFITFVGPLVYLLCHPRIFYGSDNE